MWKTDLLEQIGDVRISVISEAQPDHDQMFVRVHVVPGYFWLLFLFLFR